MNKSFYNFEKIEVRGLFYFNFFNRNVQSKHVCQLAYNLWLTEGLLLLKPLKTLEKVLQIYMVIYNN
jgi:hypothetical protein